VSTNRELREGGFGVEKGGETCGGDFDRANFTFDCLQVTAIRFVWEKIQLGVQRR